MSTQTFPGSCFSGAVRYRLTSPPMFVHCCHCRDCQHQTSAPFVVNALIERDRVELLCGEPRRHTLKTDSGRPHDVYRCEECGSTLWSDYGRREVMAFVRVATLDDPGRFPPDAHIFTRSKFPWVDLTSPAAGATTQAPALVCDVYYDMETVWPAASLARRETLLGPRK